MIADDESSSCIGYLKKDIDRCLDKIAVNFKEKDIKGQDHSMDDEVMTHIRQVSEEQMHDNDFNLDYLMFSLKHAKGWSSYQRAYGPECVVNAFDTLQQEEFLEAAKKAYESSDKFRDHLYNKGDGPGNEVKVEFSFDIEWAISRAVKNNCVGAAAWHLLGETSGYLPYYNAGEDHKIEDTLPIPRFLMSMYNQKLDNDSLGKSIFYLQQIMSADKTGSYEAGFKAAEYVMNNFKGENVYEVLFILADDVKTQEDDSTSDAIDISDTISKIDNNELFIPTH